MAANPYQSPRMREKEKKQKKIKKILFGFLFLAVITFFIYITNASFLRLEQIIVDDVEYSNREDIELSIKENLEGRYLGMFSKSNALIFPRNKISRDIKNNFPSIKKIDLDLGGLSTINVQLEEYVASAIWCDVPVTPANTLTHDENGEETVSVIPQVVNNFNGDDCYFMNEDGIVFAKTKYDQNTEIIKTFGFITVDPVRQNYADPETFKNLVEFTKLLRRLNIVADQVWTTNGEVYAIVTKDRVKIYIDSEGDILEVFDNLETVIKRDAINQAQFANIDYIDLRFGNRVFYKLR